ncbi:MAG TPA: YetF domain-containing protein [Trueperaceae bacterium]
METVVRVVIVYFAILVGLRVLGKREFGQLSPLELVTLLLIPELVTNALVVPDHSMTNAFVALTTILSLVFISSLIQHLSKRMETVITGSPTVLVAHGQLLETVMNQERVTPEEIFDAMHKSGLERLEQVGWAVLESDGKIAIIPEGSGGAAIRRQEQLAG